MGKFDIDRPIAELFSVEPYALRIRNVCNSHDIATIRELCLHSNWDLLHFRHLGERSIAHMEEMLGNFGLRLGMTEEDLDAYMRFETEDDKDVTTIMRFEESEEVKWDQRRYEVARDLYVRYRGLSPYEAMEEAEKLILALQVIAEDLHGSRFCYKGQEYELGIPGIYQIYNSITAIEVCNCIKKQYDLKNVSIKNGLKKTLWEGRFQKIKDVPLTYIDGAHNEGGWRSLRENIRAYFTGRPLIYICGVLADKEYEKMVDIMAPFASFIITVTPDNPRALDKEILAECYRSYGKPVDTAEDVFAAQRQAETLAQELTEPVIVVFGSLSFIGPLIPRISSTINQERTTEKK